MKKPLLHFLILLGLSTLMYSCVADISLDSETDQTGQQFSVDEARACFEDYISAGTKAGKSVPGSSIVPKNFTPDWNKALMNSNGLYEGVDVPVISSRTLIAVASQFSGGRGRPYSVTCYQKVVVLKNKKTSGNSVYLLSIIPDKEYYGSNKNNVLDKFLNCGSKAEFSGITIHSDVNTGELYRVTRFEKGKIVEGVFLPNEKDRTAGLEKARQILGSVSIVAASAMPTRSMEIIDGGDLPEIIIDIPGKGGGDDDDDDDDDDDIRYNDDPFADIEPYTPDDPDENEGKGKDEDKDKDKDKDENKDKDKDTAAQEKVNYAIQNALAKLERILNNNFRAQYANITTKVSGSVNTSLQLTTDPNNPDRLIVSCLQFNTNDVMGAGFYEMNLMILHEMYHYYKLMLNGGYYPAIWGTQDAIDKYVTRPDHNEMVNDPVFLSWLQEMFPLSTQEVIEALAHYGASDNETYTNMSDEELLEIHFIWNSCGILVFPIIK